MQLFSRFWLVAWSFALALGWLLPNHYAPWTTFHMDGWVAFMLLLASAGVFLRAKGAVAWHGISLLVAALVAVPLLQYGFGLILISGTAWICTAYLLGLMMAILAGAQWELASPGQVLDGLFLSTGVAAIVSVGLQLHQWLALDLLGVWTFEVWGEIPFANFGQANQLGTFLLWGLLAVAWGVVRQQIGVGVALLAAVFLLFGVSLTASRTAWLGVLILVGASWIWRSVWADRRVPWFATGLGLYFATCVNAVSWISQLMSLDLPGDVGVAIRVGGQTRLEVWAVFIDAIFQHPVFGYGWNQGGLAFMTAMSNHPSLNLLFSSAHNLFLDLFVWCGIPIGLFISIFLLRWLWISLRKVRTADNAVLLMLLVVVGNHAMLEMPLHHGYFLLPIGLVIGVINVRLQVPPVFVVGRVYVCALWLLSALLLAVITRDYARVETSYLGLRFAEARIKTDIPSGPPELILLTQWSEFFSVARVVPHEGMRAAELDQLRAVASILPGKWLLHNLAAALAMNDQPEEAKVWLKRLCKNEPEFEWQIVKAAWAQRSLSNPKLAAVPWPQ